MENTLLQEKSGEVRLIQPNQSELNDNHHIGSNLIPNKELEVHTPIIGHQPQ